MLKTQITGAKYLSPQTNQMTNLNIAIPADSKDTKFGTSDILLAKDVVAYLNALDSDISNELATQTDKINKINESIKQLIDHNLIKIVTELPTTDIDKNCIYLVPNKDGEGNNVFIEYIYVESKNTFEEVGRIQAKVDLSDYYTKEETDNLILIAKNSAINIHNEDNTKSIKLDINDHEAVGDYGSTVNVSLTDGSYQALINVLRGFTHKAEDGFKAVLNSEGMQAEVPSDTNSIYAQYAATYMYYRYNDDIYFAIDTDEDITDHMLHPYITLGPDNSFKISRPNDNEGGVISGIKSLTAFANPSATKVWATDGSTVDLSTKANTSDLATKANTSDVLLKKSDSGGYYIEGYINLLGLKAFAANGECTASGNYSFAEGSHIKARGSYSHAEGVSTEAIGTGSHAEGNGTKALGNYAHAEGETTKALGDYSHAEGQSTMASGNCSHAEGCNTDAKSYSHAEGNYTHAVGTYTHAEGEYTSANGSYSHAEGFATYSNGNASHSEGYSTKTNGHYSHAEGNYTEATGFAEHALGTYNVVNKNAIHSVGIGNSITRKNAEYIYAKSNENSSSLVDDPKNGYKYLIGVGGYDGISTDNSTYKSVQEVIADLTARIEQLETKVRALEAANTPA